MTIKIRGKTMNFGAEQINDIYVLPHVDMGDFKEKGCERGCWLGKILCPEREVCWIKIESNISMNNFTYEA